jgi:ABC-type sugar transport system ATPase subunit
VASFIGSPPMNILPASLCGVDSTPGALVGIRPQDLTVGASGALPAHVELVEPRGHDCLVHVRLDAAGLPSLVALVSASAMPGAGDAVFVTIPDGKHHLFDGLTGSRLAGLSNNP